MIRLGKKMERYEIVYHMDADFGIDGIAVHEVADVMYAFSEAVNEAMRLTGADGTVHVNVKPFRNGSFITEFVVTYQQQIVPFFTSQEMTALCNALGLLGFLGTAAGASVPAIVRHVRGRIDKHRDNGDGTYTYGDDGDAAPITVGEEAHKVIQSPKVAKAMKTVAVGPMVSISENIRVTIQEKGSFERREPGGGSEFDLNDISDMEEYEAVAVDGPPDERDDTVDEIQGVPVSPVSGPYDGGKNGYSFKCCGDKWHGVQMLDASFRAKLARGEVRLAKQDSLIVDVRVTTSVASNGKETVSRAITHVSEYRPYKPAEQLSLDDLGNRGE